MGPLRIWAPSRRPRELPRASVRCQSFQQQRRARKRRLAHSSFASSLTSRRTLPRRLALQRVLRSYLNVKLPRPPARWAMWQPPHCCCSFIRFAALSPCPSAIAFAASRALSEKVTASATFFAFQYAATFVKVSTSLLAAGGCCGIGSITNRGNIRRIRLHQGFEFVIADLSAGQSREDCRNCEEKQRLTHG